MSIFKGNIPEDTSRPAIPAEEDAVMDKFARKVVEWRMAVPAILFIESGRPLNYIASQAMIVAQPLAQPTLEMFFNFQEYDVFRQALERRENVEIVLQKIEKYDAEVYHWEKKIKAFMKAERKKWTWSQRYLGLKRPRIILPEDLTPPWKRWGQAVDKKERPGDDRGGAS